MAHLLLAEDEPAIRTIILDLLTSEGHTVDAVSNGKDALRRLRERRPDGIVLDLMMPVMDGWGFLAALEREPEGRNIPVLVLSAITGQVAVPGSSRIRAVVDKPFDLEKLLEGVRRLLEARGGRLHKLPLVERARARHRGRRVA